MKLHTRIAPSPTGDMHIGTARTAYFNWLAARATGGNFLLRIDDTDIERSKPEFTKVIIDTMKWLGLDYDQMIKQSDRFAIYLSEARDLVKKGLAIQKVDGSIVLYPSDNDIPNEWNDELSGHTKVSDFEKTNLAEMCIIKKDGSPTYHFASVIDDISHSINCVIRGVDHFSNTAKQITIYRSLGKENDIPKYYHVGLIHDGKKLSKREGAASMLKYQSEGFDPDAMLNFMVRLGWGPTVDDKSTSVLPKARMLELFIDGGKMKNSAANMDAAKLHSFDKKYKILKNHVAKS